MRTKRSTRTLVSLGLLALGPLATHLASSPAPQSDPEPRFFSMPLTRDARQLAETVKEHIAAQRWGDATAGLQELLENHGGALLPDGWRASHDQPSQFPAHPGAAEWALDTFETLPTEALTIYDERFGPRAERALARARANADRHALVEVGRRWPATRAAAMAWWTLGDLELEEGRTRAALFSWMRGVSVDRMYGLGLRPGAEARFEHARGRMEGRRSGGGRGPIPAITAQPWSTDLDLRPFDRRSGHQPHYNLFPALGGGKVVVSSTLHLYALDSFTGERLWTAGPPSGWGQLSDKKQDRLFQGISDDNVLIAPAIGGNVVVAAMQLPFSQNDNEDWQGIKIMTAIPERRLFAFDLETGEELWNHAPRLTWGGNSWNDDGLGGYAERMLVAGPPVVADSRVLVPCYRMEGRIEYHVACYALETGELLWSTPVVSGQRERNMFGRAREEFGASPVVVTGDRIIAQTELGTVAALDLLTGRLIWESLYNQIVLPKTRSYAPPKREHTWRIGPPMVSGNLVVCAPSDSHELVAFYLDDGRAAWAYNEIRLRRKDPDTEHLGFNALLGIDQDTVYLGGEKIAALQKPGDLSKRSPFRSRWSFPMTRHMKEPADRAPRAVLTKDSVLVPGSLERLVLDRSEGVLQSDLTGVWTSHEHGTVLLQDGVMFTLSPRQLHGFFDWDALVERQRQRLEARPGDPGLRLELAELYSRRGRSLLDEGRLPPGLRSLERASEILEELVEASRAGDGDPRLARRSLEELHLTLRARAEGHALQGSRPRALELVDRALELASSPLEERDTLLQKEALLGKLARPEEHLAVLDELLVRCPDLRYPITAEEDAPPPAWLVGTTAYTEHGLEGWEGADLPLTLWVELARAETQRAAGRLPEALEALHGALAQYGDTPISPETTLDEILRERIAMLLLRPDGMRAYARFEERARALLDAALASGKQTDLVSVGRLYPHSRAASEAQAARLTLAFDAGDSASVAAIVHDSMLRPGQRDSEIQNLLRLGRSLGLAGNATFETSLLTHLAEEAPDLHSALDGHGATLRELADRPARETVPVLLPRFSSTLASTGAERTGDYGYVGQFPLEIDGQETTQDHLQVYLVTNLIEAYSSSSPNSPVWTYRVPESVRGDEACVLTEGLVIVGDEGTVRAIDRSGDGAWTQLTGNDPVQRIHADSGLVVATLTSGRLMAFDAVKGTHLWTLEFDHPLWDGPVLGNGFGVLFAPSHGQAPRAVVIDLFRGRVETEIVLDKVDANLEKAAWIEGDRLVLPSFRTFGIPPGIYSYDLRQGKADWTLLLDEDEEFHSIAQHAGDTYLITRSQELGISGSPGAIYQLDAMHGTRRRVVPLQLGEEPMGIRARERVELPAPYLFTYSPESAGRGIPVRAVHLPYRTLWKYTLPVAPEELRLTPMPAVSSEYVAIAYSTGRPNNGDTSIVFVDKRDGRKRDSISLNDNFSAAHHLELRGLGEALFVVATAHYKHGLRMEILETPR